MQRPFTAECSVGGVDPCRGRRICREGEEEILGGVGKDFSQNPLSKIGGKFNLGHEFNLGQPLESARVRVSSR